jgi:hypothetical protein
MELLFYILAPLVTLLYKFLDYNKWIDKITGRELRISGLKRLQTCTGFPDGWIYDDEKDAAEFTALIKAIKANTKSEKLKAVFKEGHLPTLIVTAGEPYQINGIDPNWNLHEKKYYSNNHPVMVIFGVNRQGGNGKGEKACTLGELDKWIEDEKKTREFWIGAFVISLLSVGLILGRLAYKKA